MRCMASPPRQQSMGGGAALVSVGGGGSSPPRAGGGSAAPPPPPTFAGRGKAEGELTKEEQAAVVAAAAAQDVDEIIAIMGDRMPEVQGACRRPSPQSCALSDGHGVVACGCAVTDGDAKLVAVPQWWIKSMMPMHWCDSPGGARLCEYCVRRHAPHRSSTDDPCGCVCRRLHLRLPGCRACWCPCFLAGDNAAFAGNSYRLACVCQAACPCLHPLVTGPNRYQLKLILGIERSDPSGVPQFDRFWDMCLHLACPCLTVLQVGASTSMQLFPLLPHPRFLTALYVCL